MRVRVLFVCATGGFGRAQLGGAERFLVEMLPALTRYFEVGALVPAGPIAEALSSSGVQVYEGAPTGRLSLRYRRRIREVIRDYNPSVVSAHLLSAAMHVRTLRGLPRVVVTLHNSMFQYVENMRGRARCNAVVNTFLERVLRACVKHGSVAVSPFEERELKRTIHRGPITLIENPLPSTWNRESISVANARERLGFSPDEKVYGFVGRFEYEKGFDRLAGLAEQLQDDERIVATGAGTLTVDHPKVTLLPRMADPYPLYRACDALVMPSRVEVFGRVAIEAVSVGTGVAHSGTGGLHDLLAPAEGLLAIEVPPRAERMALALRDLASKREDERAMTVAESYDRTYSFKVKVEQWRQILEA